MSQGRFWNIPNTITLARALVLPPIVILISQGVESPRNSAWAALLFLLGGAMDGVDGYLARRLNQITDAGKFLDPLIDKIMYLVCLVALQACAPPRIAAWVIMLSLVRELFITGLRTLAANEGLVIPAGPGGKIKTATGFAGVVALLWHYPLTAGISIPMQTLGEFLTYFSLVVGYVSALQYILGFVRARSHED